MTDTKFYKLLNLIQKGDRDAILSYAKAHSYLIKDVAKYKDEYGYYTPVCMLVIDGKSDIAFELTKLNPSSVLVHCGGYSDCTALDYLIDKNAIDLVVELAKLNPKVLENNCGFHKDYTPICSLVDKTYINKALELAKLNPKSLLEKCGYYSENVVDFLIERENIDLALKFGKINAKTVSANIMKDLIEKEGIKDEQILSFAKLNPVELDKGNDTPMMHAIKLGKTDLADKLIEILDEYNAPQTEHVDL